MSPCRPLEPLIPHSHASVISGLPCLSLYETEQLELPSVAPAGAPQLPGSCTRTCLPAEHRAIDHHQASNTTLWPDDTPTQRHITVPIRSLHALAESLLSPSSLSSRHGPPTIARAGLAELAPELASHHTTYLPGLSIV